jgi:hypothetical protein
MGTAVTRRDATPHKLCDLSPPFSQEKIIFCLPYPQFFVLRHTAIPAKYLSIQVKKSHSILPIARRPIACH